MIRTVIFPSSVDDPARVDEELKQEYNAALETGLYQVLLFNCEDWFVRGELKLSERMKCDTPAVYRGWVMKPEQYRSFYIRLLEQNVSLITDPDMYTLMHIFPNVYPHLAHDTARILTFPRHARIDIEPVKAIFERFMVRDYMKTAVEKEFPFYFGPAVTQEEFDGWMETFFSAGDASEDVYIKEYLNLKRYRGKNNEFRVFYINHRVVSVCRRSALSVPAPNPPLPMIDRYKNLDSLFYTLDFAELENGTWKIMEAGDGSVSGLAEGQDCADFFRMMYECLNVKKRNGRPEEKTGE